MAWNPLSVDEAVLEQEGKVQDRYQLSFWDAMIVAAPKSLSCGLFLTEDLQADRDFERLVVVDPFAATTALLLRG